MFISVTIAQTLFDLLNLYDKHRSLSPGKSIPKYSIDASTLHYPLLVLYCLYYHIGDLYLLALIQ